MNTFSKLYLAPPPVAVDSPKARSRIGGYCSALHFRAIDAIRETIDQELGIHIVSGSRIPNIRRFFDVCEHPDFLDALTHVVSALQKNEYWQEAHDCRAFISRVLAEQNLPYRLGDDDCIHPLVDSAFERERASILMALSAVSFPAARNSLQLAFDSLKPDGTGTHDAVRHCFDAVENVFKATFPEKLLGAVEIKRWIEPIIAKKYEGRAANAGLRLVAAFKEYVNAMHQYRHADGEPAPTPPPIDLAVLLLSQGTANLRWLLGLIKDMPAD